MSEDEYSYPPTKPGDERRPPRARRPVHLDDFSVQITAPSKRRAPTRVLYATPLTDEQIARIKAKHSHPTRRA